MSARSARRDRVAARRKCRGDDDDDDDDGDGDEDEDDNGGDNNNNSNNNNNNHNNRRNNRRRSSNGGRRGGGGTGDPAAIRTADYDHGSCVSAITQEHSPADQGRLRPLSAPDTLSARTTPSRSGSLSPSSSRSPSRPLSRRDQRRRQRARVRSRDTTVSDQAGTDSDESVSSRASSRVSKQPTARPGSRRPSTFSVGSLGFGSLSKSLFTRAHGFVSHLASRTLPRPVDPKRHIVWLLDNTAYIPLPNAAGGGRLGRAQNKLRGLTSGNHDGPLSSSDGSDIASPPSWHVPIVACVFDRGGSMTTRVDHFLAQAAKACGLGEKLSINWADTTTRERLERRLTPFMLRSAVGRIVTVDVPLAVSARSGRRVGVRRQLRATDGAGMVDDSLSLGDSGKGLKSEAVVHGRLVGWAGKGRHAGSGRPDDAMDSPAPSSARSPSPQPSTAHSGVPSMEYMRINFAGPTGWLVISDVDDTIKRTMTPEPDGVLRTTFAEKPQAIAGMPGLYRRLYTQLPDAPPAFFYLSASPYRIYPFLRKFLRSFYPPGTLCLKQWAPSSTTAAITHPAALIDSLLSPAATQTYKTTRLRALHTQFPRRRALCFGDSTQRDPEAYAEMYHATSHSHGSNGAPWIRGIFIRKVIGVAAVEPDHGFGSNAARERAFERNNPDPGTGIDSLNSTTTNGNNSTNPSHVGSDHADLDSGGKNSSARFEAAFSGLPRNVWHVFEHPDEIWPAIVRIARAAREEDEELAEWELEEDDEWNMEQREQERDKQARLERELELALESGRGRSKGKKWGIGMGKGKRPVYGYGSGSEDEA